MAHIVYMGTPAFAVPPLQALWAAGYEIGAVIVWQVVETARALFDVENYAQFVDIQSETAIRALASEYPYDTQREDETSLRGSQQEIAEMLKLPIGTIKAHIFRARELLYKQLRHQIRHY